jgi:hypothetical protein
MKKPPFQVAPPKSRFELRLKKVTTHHHGRKLEQSADELFCAIDWERPERELDWIHNPSAPATTEELEAFFADLRKLLKTEDGTV